MVQQDYLYLTFKPDPTNNEEEHDKTQLQTQKFSTFKSKCTSTSKIIIKLKTSYSSTNPKAQANLPGIRVDLLHLQELGLIVKGHHVYTTFGRILDERLLFAGIGVNYTRSSHAQLHHLGNLALRKQKKKKNHHHFKMRLPHNTKLWL